MWRMVDPMSTNRTNVAEGTMNSTTLVICGECGVGNYTEWSDHNGAYYKCTACTMELGLSDFVLDDDDFLLVTDAKRDGHPLLHVVHHVEDES